jgi:phytoene dehydrogenase-like protein
VLGLSVATAACGRYSISNIRSLKAFQDANALYNKADYRAAIERYEAAIAHNPDSSNAILGFAYFFLGNSYDNLYKPARAFAAKDAVIAALHPHDLGKMVEGLAPEVVQAADATQISDIACITVHAALKAPLKFRAGAHVRAVMIELLPNKYDTIRKSFDCLRYGEFSTYPLVGLGSLTMFDPSRAPAGNATLHAWDYVPYQRTDGRGWDDTKHHYVKRILSHMENFVDNVADNVIAYHSDSPVDMERTSPSFRRGDLHGVASTTYQYGAHRPTPDLGSNVVPGCERLYLVGPFQHPGGGVFGAGRAAAMRACEDLKLDFSKVGARG